MPKHLFFPVLLLWASQLAAQAPGYLGKQLVMKVEGSSMLALGATTKNKGLFADGESGGSLGFDTRIGLQISHALNRRQAAAFTFNYLKTGMESEAETPSIDGSSPFGELDYHYLFYHLKGYTFGAGYLWFKTKKGAIAPVGVYGGLHLQATLVRGEVVQQVTDYANSFANESAPLGISGKYTYYSLAWEFGQNSILFDKLLVSIAGQLSVPFLNGNYQDGWAGSDYLYDYAHLGYPAQNQAFFENKAYSRMLAHGLFTIKLGVGFLAF